MSIPWEALGLIPALFFALNGLFIRLGIDHSTPQTGNLIVVLVNLLGFTLALAWVDFTTIEYSVYWLVFLLAGLCSPALSLLFLFRSIKEIGVSATTPLSNIHAITGSFFAFILLGERPPAAVWAGILCVTIGVYILSGGDKLSGLAGRLKSPRRPASRCSIRQC